MNIFDLLFEYSNIIRIFLMELNPNYESFPIVMDTEFGVKPLVTQKDQRPE
jgi:hypothetical protein